MDPTSRNGMRGSCPGGSSSMLKAGTPDCLSQKRRSVARTQMWLVSESPAFFLRYANTVLRVMDNDVRG